MNISLQEKIPEFILAHKCIQEGRGVKNHLKLLNSKSGKKVFKWNVIFDESCVTSNQIMLRELFYQQNVVPDLKLNW